MVCMAGSRSHLGVPDLVLHLEVSPCVPSAESCFAAAVTGLQHIYHSICSADTGAAGISMCRWAALSYTAPACKRLGLG